MRPIHNICLENERVNVARAMLIAGRYCEARTRLLCIRVDEVLVDMPRRSREKFAESIGSVTYRNAHHILPEGCVPRYQKPGASDECVFKPVQAKTEVQWTGGVLRPFEEYEVTCPELTCPELTCPEAHVPERVAQGLEWVVVNEPPCAPLGVFVENTVIPHVKAGKSCAIVGDAGTGKTHALKAIEADLKQQGLSYVKLCLSHVGARNLGEGGQVVHSFVMRSIVRGTCKVDVVLLDEISFVSIDLIAALETLRLRGTRIICFGDFEQLPPISNRWRGCPVQADVFERSRLFKQWSDCTKFVLTECRRSDEPHFALYTAVKQLSLIHI